MSLDELTAKLSVLQASGVTLAEFSPDGELTKVIFGYQPPAGEAEEPKESPELSMVRKATQVLNGKWRPEYGLVGPGSR